MFKHILTNRLEYSSKEKGNSAPWLAEIANHANLYDILEHRVLPTEQEQKRGVKVQLDDATYSGANFNQHFNALECGFDIYIAPFLKSLEFAAARQDGKIHNIYFLNAKDHVLYKTTTSKQPGEFSLEKVETPAPEVMRQHDVEHRRVVVIIYYEEMNKVPFYFDHKMADFTSWPADLWKMRGFHTNYYIDTIDSGRTSFIDGCEVDEHDKKGTSDFYYCPKPPYNSNREQFGKKQEE
jgi:hypothetical protein